MSILRLLSATALVALLLPAAAVSTPSPPRPFKATCTAIPEDPLSPQVRVMGTCQSTHLGRETFTAFYELVPTGPPEASEMLPVAIVGGRGTHSPPTGTNCARPTPAPGS